MIEKVEFTHYGWFGICPAIFAELDSEAPFIEPRWSFLNKWMDFNELIIGFFINLKTRIDVDYEPSFSIVISGEFKNPLVREFKIYEE